jgi:diguanylate cyclase (GGDEF)-like protein
MAIDGASTMVETDDLAQPALSVLLALALSLAGAWSALRAVAFADGKELLAFGALAFACGLLRLRIEPTSPLSKVKLGTVAAITSIPFLGPAAIIPAMLATLAQAATDEETPGRSPRAVLDVLRVPASALVGGAAYTLVNGRLGILYPMPFLVAVTAFVVTDMAMRYFSGATAWTSRQVVFSSVTMLAAGWMAATWRQFCPSQIALITAIVIAGIWAASVLMSRKSNIADTLEWSQETTVEAAVDEDRLSLVDPLTGLANDRYLYMFLNQEIGRSVRKNLPVSLVLLDLDDFQSVNLDHGSEASDAVMVEIGRLLKSVVREYDIIVRYSSDEFAIVLPEAKCSDACERAERIREQIAHHSFGGSINVKVSAGVSTYPEHGMTADDLVSSAHHALNRAKFAGKNRVMSCTEILGKLKYGT